MKGKSLRENIHKTIENNWPTHIREIVRDLGFEVTNSNIKKIAYHVMVLKNEERVRVKRIGKALVVWPMDMERLRLIHEMLR